jgi:hypothetical protein
LRRIPQKANGCFAFSSGEILSSFPQKVQKIKPVILSSRYATIHYYFSRFNELELLEKDK